MADDRGDGLRVLAAVIEPADIAVGGAPGGDGAAKGSDPVGELRVGAHGDAQLGCSLGGRFGPGFCRLPGPEARGEQEQGPR